MAAGRCHAKRAVRRRCAKCEDSHEDRLANGCRPRSPAANGDGQLTRKLLLTVNLLDQIDGVLNHRVQRGHHLRIRLISAFGHNQVRELRRDVHVRFFQRSAR
jgi:hypothetical protein